MNKEMEKRRGELAYCAAICAISTMDARHDELRTLTHAVFRDGFNQSAKIYDKEIVGPLVKLIECGPRNKGQSCYYINERLVSICDNHHALKRLGF